MELAAEFRASVLKKSWCGIMPADDQKGDRSPSRRLRINKDTRRMPPKRIGCVLSLEFREE